MSSKVCKRCGESKPTSEFGLKKGLKPHYNYFRALCKPCHTQYNLENRKKNGRKMTSKEVEGAKVRSKDYYFKNKQVKSFKSKRCGVVSKRRATKRKATPPWLSKRHQKEIQNLFWLTRDLRSVTGEEYHVDHIVPLRNEIVCGLHVPWNLQILPSDINLSKSNSFDDQEEGLNYAH